MDAPPLRLPERYRWRAALGRGGMGEVHEVDDTLLGRVVALKSLRIDGPAQRARFLEEAQVAAQLEHPNIVPVYDYGLTPDGACYFTMKVVRGEGFHRVMQATLRAEAPTGRLGPRFRALVQQLLAVARAVAYAHDHGVVHRDLKPQNVMVGRFGEVLVLDWGLAKVLGVADSLERIRTVRSGDGAHATADGRVGGTPSYMPPEQALGDLHAIGPWTDVWALGVMLYQCLTGHRPFGGRAREAILAQVLSDAPVRAPSAWGAPWEVPGALEDLAMRCLQRDAPDRPQAAGAVAEALQAWVDGATAVQAAEACLERADALAKRRHEVLRRVQGGAASVPDEARAAEQLLDEQTRWERWAVEDQVVGLRQEAEALEQEQVRALREALRHDPESPEAHRRMAAMLRREHERAEAERRTADAARIATELRSHDRGEHAAYLDGTGSLSLATERPVEALLYRVVTRHRRSVLEVERSLGPTPLRSVPVSHGAWVVGLGEHRLSLWVGREEHVQFVPPGATRALTLPLPAPDPGSVYVPAGWAWLGARDEAQALPWGRRWVDGFLMRRVPFTFGELSRLLAYVESTRGMDAARALVPREERNLALVERGAEGWVTTTDPEGFRPGDRHPVFGVTGELAERWAELEAERTGQPWRLPTEHEWEKAARGAAGRVYPWGDVPDPARAHWHGAVLATGVVIEAVGAREADVSVYGVMDMAGNLADWARDDDGILWMRGGAFNRTETTSTCWYRWLPSGSMSRANQAVRFVCSVG